MFDVAVIGAGAAGMMCAAVAGQRGASVVLIDHASKLAEKIRISGGGRCNFTNVGTQPANFISGNPHFCRSALAGYTPQDFLALLREHGVSWHEKHRGQLFCDTSSEAIIDVLRRECAQARVTWRMPCTVDTVAEDEHGFTLQTTDGVIAARSLVVATGGMAIPQLGATDFGLKLARQFGLKVVEPRPALVPLTFAAPLWAPFAPLAGLAIEAEVSTGVGKQRTTFLEDVLFTHRGLSGPGILQISSYWGPNTPIAIDLAPGRDLADELMTARRGNRQQLATVLAAIWPRRLADAWLSEQDAALAAQRLADVSDRALRALGDAVHRWELAPDGTQGYKKAEVMSGGVDTRQLDQRSMQARNVRGLHFIGEVVDVTGWLGGYNFQWAWASAVACGRAVSAAPE